MTALCLSASLVLYKPDIGTLERTLLALQEAGRFAKESRELKLDLTLVDNTGDAELHAELLKWEQRFSEFVPDWSLHVLRSPGNVGYGRGNNSVIVGARSDYHVVVNPDLFVNQNALFESIEFMEQHPETGLLSPSVFGEDGARHYLCKRNPTLRIMFLRSFSPRWLREKFSSVVFRFEMRDHDYEKIIHALEYPTGCFMFFRTAPLQKIGGFDPDFFLHYEDADIGRRMLRVADVVYVPGVRVVHRWARNTHRSLAAMFVTVLSGLIYCYKWRSFW